MKASILVPNPLDRKLTRQHLQTKFDKLPNYLISTSKPLERFNLDDEFEESGELGAGNDSDYDAEDLDEHAMESSDLQPEDDTN